MLSIPARRISFTKRSCSVSNSRSIRPLACGLCAAIHSIPHSWSARPKCRPGFFSPQLSPQRRRSRRPEDAVFIGVMRQRTSVAPHPFPESPQVLFGGVVFGETAIETAGGVIDHRNQLTSRPALLEPSKRRAILHHQLTETGSSLAPHMHGLHALGARTPQGRLGHPLPQRLPAHRKTLLGQVFRGQRGTEIRITLAQARQNLLLEPGRQLAVRWPAPQSVNQGTIPALAKAEQHPPHLAVGYFQPRGCC